jgi:hypothetical protein
MYPLKQSTALTVPFFVHDVNGDPVLSLTDGSFTKRISKNGGAFGAMTVTITEMENGWYSIPLSSSHSDTLGLLSIVFTNAGAKQVNLQFRVSVRIPDDLAFPTTAGRSIDVTAAGEVGLDLDNTVGTLSTAEIPLLDAAITSRPTAAQVNAEVDTALAQIHLDHLIANASGPTPTAGSYLADIMGAGFLTATDSLEAIRNQGDSAWITAVGFSTHSAADAADAVWLELLSDHEATVGSAAEALFDLYNTRIPVVLSQANIETWSQAGAAAALVAIDLDHLSFAGAAPAPTAGSNLANLMGAGFLTATDSLEAIRNQGDAAWITAVGFAIPGSAMNLTAGALTAIGVEVDNALAAIRLDELLVNAGGAPGAGSVFEDFMGATFSSATDSLEALRAAVDALNNLSAAQVNVEVSDVLKTDVVTLPGQVAPPLTPTMEEILAWMYKTFRNKKDQSASAWQLYDNAGTTVDAKATVSDAAGVATKEQIESGP